MKRRDLLRYSAATFIYLTAGCGGKAASTDTKGDDPTLPGGKNGQGQGGPDTTALVATSPPDRSDARFPQGLASGDPRPDRVVLWTRVEPRDLGKAAHDPVELGYVIAKDEALHEVVARGTLVASPDGDHAVRLVPVGLEPATRYYYRFEAQGVTTQVGRTKTAPAEGADVPVTFAFAACQDFVGRYYHAWRALLDEGDDLDFVLFLGDYVYETINDPSFQTVSKDRAVVLPDGMDISDKQDRSTLAAGTLADYRALYKTYRSDAFLKEVHRRFPFITIWDDHEFANDCWQDHSTYFAEKDPVTGQFTDEKNTARRQAATRAWFEYQPVAVPFDANQPFPSDITEYRSLRYGKHVELFLTDERLYRDDHVIPEGPRDLSVGKFLANSAVGSRYLVRKAAFDSLEASRKPTMLGETQRSWFVDAVKASNATWKIWGNEVQLWQQAVDLSKIDGVPSFLSTVVYVDLDQWDGYRSERAKLLTELAGVKNLVACTGDIHAFFASELHSDFDAPAAPTAVEFVTAGISSASLASIIKGMVGNIDLLKSFVPNLIANLDQAQLGTNPHLVHADSNAQGFARVAVSSSQLLVTFLKVGDPTVATYGGVIDRTSFVTKRDSSRIDKA
jgi:alkaline phosphatase D